MKTIHPHAINFKPLCIFFLIFIPFCSSSFTKLVGQNGSPEKNIGNNPRAIVELALRNNPELAIRKLDEKVGADSVKQAKGEFDPELFAEVSYGQRQMTQNTKDFFASGGDPNTHLLRFFEEKGLRLLAGFGGKLPIGLLYSLEVQVNQLENNIIKNNAYNLFLPEVETFYGLRLTQPLLRGGNRNANLAEFFSAQHSAARERADVAAARLLLAGDVFSAYADLLWHTQEIRNREEETQRLEKEIDSVRLRIERGESSQEALLSAERNAHAARDQFLLADLRRRKASLALRTLAGEEGTDDIEKLWSMDNTSFPTPSLSRSVLIHRALAEHPALVATRSAYEREEALVVGARNDKYPRLDFDVSVGYLGLADDVSASTRAVVESDRPEIGAGLRFSYDFGGHAAKGALGEALARRRQASLSFVRARRSLVTDIRHTFSEWEAAKIRCEHANSSLAEAEVEYDEAQDRLGRGLAKSVDTLPHFRGVVSARTRLYKEENARDTALARLLTASGIILEYPKTNE